MGIQVYDGLGKLIDETLDKPITPGEVAIVKLLKAHIKYPLSDVKIIEIYRGFKNDLELRKQFEFRENMDKMHYHRKYGSKPSEEVVEHD